ncbi:hypothetical protein PIB30_104406, partial [Stylosanthes scabra]|nr:hypothetical protein [Stylosanthes scabra]
RSSSLPSLAAALPAASFIGFPLFLPRYYVPLQHHRSCLFPILVVPAGYHICFGPGFLPLFFGWIKPSINLSFVGFVIFFARCRRSLPRLANFLGASP